MQLLSRLAALSVVLVFLTGTVSGAVPLADDTMAAPGGTVSGIGPDGERTDNPWAAAFVAGVVAIVIYRGIRRYDAAAGQSTAK